LIRTRQYFVLAAIAALSASSNVAARPNKLQARISALLSKFPAVQRGHFGFKFIELTNNTVLAEHEAAAFFTTASNTKLYTTSLALVRLGPNYRFQTELRTSGVWNPGQTSLPDLQIIGGGDPNLSGRVLPYNVNAKAGDPLASLRDLAKKLSDAGVKTIEGNVTGVATRYPGELFPDGWTISDSIYEYGAPVSALTFNDNGVSVTLHPTASGELAAMETMPLNCPLFFTIKVITDDTREAQVHMSRALGSNEVLLWGTIGKNSDPWQQDFAVTDPARCAASALIEVLRDQGITVRGNALSLYRSLDEPSPASLPKGTMLAVHQSLPLSEVIKVTNKVSQNLHAEMLLREVGFVSRGSGTLRDGLDERAKFLQELGIARDGTDVALLDGSGLARQDLTTPDSTVALLRAMWARPEREVWLASLPVGGIDGTLEHRFEGIAGADRVHAKTGSLSHVNALSGYIETHQHRWLAFSIMVNSTVGHERDVRNFIDHLCALFL
jgi:D-alanyl-D-alanine carboxypeptidase/D-alanyl-D-alanine-endopeptidase (penicillin-binding protein 4)